MLAATVQKPMPLNDLIRDARLGEPDAIAGIYKLYAHDLFQLALRFAGSPQDAEDLVHDLFVGLPEALGRYEERGKLESWLKRVLVRLALMKRRSEGRKREVSLESESPAMAQPERTDPSELFALHQAMAELPDSLRLVLEMKQIEGFSHKEIGALLGISAGASRVRFVRAVQALRKEMRCSQ